MSVQLSPTFTIWSHSCVLTVLYLCLPFVRCEHTVCTNSRGSSSIIALNHSGVLLSPEGSLTMLIFCIWSSLSIAIISENSETVTTHECDHIVKDVMGDNWTDITPSLHDLSLPKSSTFRIYTTLVIQSDAAVTHEFALLEKQLLLTHKHVDKEQFAFVKTGIRSLQNFLVHDDGNKGTRKGANMIWLNRILTPLLLGWLFELSSIIAIGGPSVCISAIVKRAYRPSHDDEKQQRHNEPSAEQPWSILARSSP